MKNSFTIVGVGLDAHVASASVAQMSHYSHITVIGDTRLFGDYATKEVKEVVFPDMNDIQGLGSFVKKQYKSVDCLFINCFNVDPLDVVDPNAAVEDCRALDSQGIEIDHMKRVITRVNELVTTIPAKRIVALSHPAVIHSFDKLINNSAVDIPFMKRPNGSRYTKKELLKTITIENVISIADLFESVLAPGIRLADGRNWAQLFAALVIYIHQRDNSDRIIYTIFPECPFYELSRYNIDKVAPRIAHIVRKLNDPITEPFVIGPHLTNWFASNDDIKSKVVLKLDMNRIIGPYGFDYRLVARAEQKRLPRNNSTASAITERAVRDTLSPTNTLSNPIGVRNSRPSISSTVQQADMPLLVDTLTPNPLVNRQTASMAPGHQIAHSPLVEARQNPLADIHARRVVVNPEALESAQSPRCVTQDGVKDVLDVMVDSEEVCLEVVDVKTPKSNLSHHSSSNFELEKEARHTPHTKDREIFDALPTRQESPLATPLNAFADEIVVNGVTFDNEDAPKTTTNSKFKHDPQLEAVMEESIAATAQVGRSIFQDENLNTDSFGALPQLGGPITSGVDRHSNSRKDVISVTDIQSGGSVSQGSGSGSHGKGFLAAARGLFTPRKTSQTNPPPAFDGDIIDSYALTFNPGSANIDTHVVSYNTNVVVTQEDVIKADVKMKRRPNMKITPTLLVPDGWVFVKLVEIALDPQLAATLSRLTSDPVHCNNSTVPLQSIAIARVVYSSSPKYSPGNLVSGVFNLARYQFLHVQNGWLSLQLDCQMDNEECNAGTCGHVDEFRMTIDTMLHLPSALPQYLRIAQIPDFPIHHFITSLSNPGLLGFFGIRKMMETINLNRASLRITKPDTNVVVVTNASSGVGQLLCQFLRTVDCVVIGMCNSKKMDVLKDLDCCDYLIPYDKCNGVDHMRKELDFIISEEGHIDGFFDLMGGIQFDAVASKLTRGGVVATVGRRLTDPLKEDSTLGTNDPAVYAHIINKQITVMPMSGVALGMANLADMKEFMVHVRSAMLSGTLSLCIDKRKINIVDAMKYYSIMCHGDTKGKLILEIE